MNGLKIGLTFDQLARNFAAFERSARAAGLFPSPLENPHAFGIPKNLNHPTRHTMNTNLNWTRRDQEELDRLLKRKEEFETRHRGHLTRVIITMTEAQPLPAVVQQFIDHADALRDALAPFDSGVRGTQDRPSV